MPHKVPVVLTAASSIICGPGTCRAEVCLATSDARPGSQWGFFLPPSRGVSRAGWGRGYFPQQHSGCSLSIEVLGAAMADEQRDLMSNRGSSMLSIGDTQRSGLGRKATLSTLSVLVALLIAGQAVTIYFVYQQSGQISKLTKTSQTLQLEALQRKLPASARPVNKMKMAMVNSPMVMKVLPLVPSVGNVALAPASNRTEDQVKHLLLADPRKTFPDLKDNMMNNLKRLKSTMTDADWKSFESWMHKWLLFEMAKNPKPEEEHKAVPATKVLTKCQAEANSWGVHPGRFQPQCDENGDYLPKQCNASTGYCWCSYKNGTRIEGTATREELDCEDAATAAPPTSPELEEMMFSGVDMLRLGAEKVN
ncbi:HLA class II histocompatibility antigen gamma chain isoform X2 [Strigops habroptila]|uniref:HLA class II histocompatibility antigen gamma chain isoform X2 n=1 Tax=Strigops habroptila TaxID=2489341 RepID=UPI0011CF161E|nr:HLA class II histocompatibility antigen gamma chain isoform X2 [Strigops habroptila]